MNKKDTKKQTPTKRATVAIREIEGVESVAQLIRLALASPNDSKIQQMARDTVAIHPTFVRAFDDSSRDFLAIICFNGEWFLAESATLAGDSEISVNPFDE
jgi:hypothetical protein